MTHPLEHIHPRSLKFLSSHVQVLLRRKLWAKILVGMFLGIGSGILLGPSVGWLSPRMATVAGEWLALPGLLFLTVIQMIVVPLVVASVIRGIASSGNVQQLKTTGIGLAVYFLITTLMATALGIGLAYLVRPGELISPEIATSIAGKQEAPEGIDTLGTEELDLAKIPEGLTSLLPANPLGAMAQGEMLQVVLFSLILGIALISLKPASSRPLLELMGSIQDVCMKVVGFVMRLAPLAVFGLLAKVMIHTGLGVLLGLGAYAASVLGALFVLLLVYVAIAMALGRRRPISFLTGIREAQLLAFTTDSSAATMPVTIKAAEENLGVRPSTAQLVIPIGATMNMGGTALYHGLATVFMAQMFGMNLPLTALLALMMTSLGASIGAPATPGVGIMILATVLTSAGVPLGGLAIIIGLDRILEPVRCVLNVSGDLVAYVVLENLAPQTLKEELARQEEIEARRAREDIDVVTD